MKSRSIAIRLILLSHILTQYGVAQVPSGASDAPGQGNKGLPAMIRHAEKGVFYLRVKDADGKVVSSGTGFLVDNKTTLATALHVIRQPMRTASVTSVEAISVGGEVCAVKGVVAVDEPLDLVLLRLDKASRDAQPLVLGPEAMPERGSKVLVLGHPMEFRFVSSDGIISAVNKTSELPDSFRKSGVIMTSEDVVWLQTTAPVSPGNSGGPMLNSSGKVIGLIQWKSRAGAGMNFALHISPLRKLLSKKEKLVLIEDFGHGESELSQVMTQFWKDSQKYAQTRQSQRQEKMGAGDDQLPVHPAVAACPKLLDIARNNTGSDLEIRSLLVLMSIASGMEGASDADPAIREASTRLLAGYSDDKRMLQLIGSFSGKLPQECRNFLRGLIQKSHDPEIQAVSTLRLAQGLAVDARSKDERDEVIRLAKKAATVEQDVTVGRGTLVTQANDLVGKASHAMPGCLSPGLTGVDKRGNQVNLADMRGRHVVVAFWDSRDFFLWIDMAMDSLVKKYKGTPISAIGVELDATGPTRLDRLPNVRQWSIIKDGEDKALKKAWHISSSPTLFLIEPDGMISGRYEPRQVISQAIGGSFVYQGMSYDHRSCLTELEKDLEAIPEIGGIRNKLRTQIMAVPWLLNDWYGTRERTVILRDNGKTSVRWISDWEARPPSGIHLHVEKIGCVDLDVDFSTGIAQVTAPAAISSRTMRQRTIQEDGHDPEAIRNLRKLLVSGQWEFFGNGILTADEPKPLRFMDDGRTDHADFTAWEALSGSRFRIYYHDGMYWTYELDEFAKVARSDMSPPAEGVNDGEIRSPKAIAMVGATERGKPDLSGVDALHAGQFKEDAGWQEIRFDPTPARHVCLQIDGSLNGIRVSAIAELELLDENGNSIPNSEWNCEYANTESSGKHWPALAWDGKPETFWHTPYVKQTSPYPHLMVIDMGKRTQVSGLRILQRADHPNGRVGKFRIYAQQNSFPYK